MLYVNEFCFPFFISASVSEHLNTQLLEVISKNANNEFETKVCQISSIYPIQIYGGSGSTTGNKEAAIICGGMETYLNEANETKKSFSSTCYKIG